MFALLSQPSTAKHFKCILKHIVKFTYITFHKQIPHNYLSLGHSTSINTKTQPLHQSSNIFSSTSNRSKRSNIKSTLFQLALFCLRRIYTNFNNLYSYVILSHSHLAHYQMNIKHDQSTLTPVTSTHPLPAVLQFNTCISTFSLQLESTLIEVMRREMVAQPSIRRWPWFQICDMKWPRLWIPQLWIHDHASVINATRLHLILL